MLQLGALPASVVVRRGSTGAAVTAVQRRLAELGFSPGTADGKFGPSTETAVRAFQSARGLAVDGVVGLQTASALGITLPASSSSAGVGSKWPLILLGVGAIGAAAWLMSKKKGGRRLRFANPPRGGRGDRHAAKFYEDFHWGRKPRRLRRVRLAPLPRRLVKLGVLEAVTYSAQKGADALADYIHHFGEGGTRKPTLAADPVTKRLHIVGGGYDVRKEGITG